MGIDKLPPEMQARIQNIMQGAATGNAPAAQAPVPQAPAQPAPAPAPAPIQKPPSLMDHVIALRSEVNELRGALEHIIEQQQAAGQVTEAVGQAVGQLYTMFQPSASPQSYSDQFAQTQFNDQEDY